MSSKRLIFLILLLMIGMAGQAAAQMVVAPANVPIGAYVNGPLGEDNYFWQTITFTIQDAGGAHLTGHTITITLPTDIDVADVALGGVIGEISASSNGAAVSALAAVAGTTKDVIVLQHTGALALTDVVTVMFPVVTSLSAPAGTTDEYTVVFQVAGAPTDDVIPGSGFDITYVDSAPNAIGAVTFDLPLTQDPVTGFYDSTLVDGEIYPALTVAAFSAGLPDYITDIINGAVTGQILIGANLPAEVLATFDGANIATVDDDDTYFRIYASTDSTLNHVDSDDTGVIQLSNHTVVAAPGPFDTYNYSQEGHTGNQGFTVANLPEGDWYIYVVNSLTGDFPLGRSDKLTVTHWPQVDVFAWDFDANGTIESGVWVAGVGDSEDMTLDTGLFYAPEGAIIAVFAPTPPIPADDIDLYISVDDFDDDAVVTLFYSATLNLDTDAVVTSGTSPDLVVTGLTGATLIVDNLEENLEDENGFLVYNWIIDSTVPAASYALYAVATDGKNLNVKSVMGFDDTKPPTYSGLNQLTMDVKHSPDLVLDSLDEYDLGTDTGGADVTIDPFQTDVIMISWGKTSIDEDKDIDDSCTIEFYLAPHEAGGNLFPEYGSDEAGNLRNAVTAHEIVIELPEDPEGKSDQYYAWNLKEDWIANAGTWAPLDQTLEIYHLYGIITEGTGKTERVICLGISGVFAGDIASTPTLINFDNADGYAKLHDPPLEGITIGATDTYRMNFEVFDIDGDQEVGIFIVKDDAYELVKNGDFADGVAFWTLGVDWSISGGEANFTQGGTATDLTQSMLSLEIATVYSVTYEVKNYNGLAAETIILTVGGDAGIARTADGIYTENFTPIASDDIHFTPSANTFSFTIDDVSVSIGAAGYTDGVMTTTITNISGGNINDGHAYGLTTPVGTLAATEWLKENDATYFDAMLVTPGGVAKYTTDLNAVANPLTDGDYWVYIGLGAAGSNFGAGETLYRAPGMLKVSGLAGGSPQQNVSMEPRKFVSTIGGIDTISVRAYSAVPVDIIDLYIAVDKTFFDPDDTTTPFIDAGHSTATLVENEAIEEANRWVLHATFTNLGDDIAPITAGLGTELLQFVVVGKGTDTAIGETTSFSYLNEPANGYVTTYLNDGNILPFIATTVNIEVMPRGIIDGIVEFEGRASSSAIVTLNLRDRGSYEPTDDATFISANDGEQEGIEGKIDAALYAPDGIQFRLDSDGKFTLYEVPEGEWELYVYYERYLAKVSDVDITTGIDALLVDFGQLLGGDAIGYTDENYDAYPNNAINQQDVIRINAAYDSTSASPWWETETNPVDGGKYNYKWADIDEDDLVGILDLTIVTGNFTYGGSANLGAQPVYMKPAVGDFESNMNAMVEFMNVPVELKAGQTYTIQIVIDNAVNVKGYDLRMDYNHSALTFLNIEKGDFIKDESNSFSLNSGDTIGLVNTVYGPTAYSGAGILAEVSFTANRDDVFTSDMLGISQALVVDNNYIAFDLFAADAPTGVGTAEVPVEFALTQNFPNPFNPTTTISFSIPKSSNIELKVYNILGRHVRTLVSGNYEAGNYSVVWNATDMSGNLVSNGVYFYIIRAADYSLTKKMLFMK